MSSHPLRGVGRDTRCIDGIHWQQRTLSLTGDTILDQEKGSALTLAGLTVTRRRGEDRCRVHSGERDANELPMVDCIGLVKVKRPGLGTEDFPDRDKALQCKQGEISPKTILRTSGKSDGTTPAGTTKSSEEARACRRRRDDVSKANAGALSAFSGNPGRIMSWSIRLPRQKEPRKIEVQGRR